MTQKPLAGRQTPDPADSRSGQVRSIARAIAILRALAASSDGLTLTETAERAQLAASTTHRILTTLEGERFVRFEAMTGLWQIGVSAFTVGATFTRNRDIIALARPYLRRLMEVTGETANIYVESGGEVICMAQVESRHTMRAITQVGGRVKMHWSGAGKALLATMPDERVRAILAEQGMPAATAATLTTPAAMLAELGRIRACGVAHDAEEFTEGLRCLSVPLRDEHGQGVAAVSISGPVSRLTPARLPGLQEVLGTIAGEIMRDFGGSDRQGEIRAGRGQGALL
ncbi:helix-turn-helix domain-containing protein [Paroceanicella profunda]|uniref:Helix-turn-helix domain-containing protein n=1 Tax=Paroceanicella profunda TaxID=2579971 RepID=A0A5B8FQ52_9RHOB|nr:IclR family transcriptional regulator C-terminal domain-containing protein [Paroceanicella profunda]QDL90475.1 helix-turn-helix domain-containing protein [Paroceanicella profunda]